MPMPRDWARRHLDEVAAAGPDYLALVRLISIDAIFAADDDLILAVDGDRQGRAPADLLFARRLPDRLARELVEGKDEGAVRALVVLEDDDLVLVKQRRAGGAVED